MKIVRPSVSTTAFNCPHCDVLTSQNWYNVIANEVGTEDSLPFFLGLDQVQEHSFEGIDAKERSEVKKRYLRLAQGEVFISTHSESHYGSYTSNVFISECTECNKISIWNFKQLIYPPKRHALPPNPDLPEHIRLDYTEASSILDLSPRGAAALLRLAIQKLCIELGESGKNLNADIASLVTKGLDKKTQKCLDAVRVIGNNAVHPGHMSITDDRSIAESLFSLVNLIAHRLISEPKEIDEIYSSLPEGARKEITKRDNKPL